MLEAGAFLQEEIGCVVASVIWVQWDCSKPILIYGLLLKLRGLWIEVAITPEKGKKLNVLMLKQLKFVSC